MSERKAMSLNERHKLLLDRSSKPKPKPRLPPSNPSPSQGEDKEEEEVETRKVKIAGRRRLCKIVSSRDDDDAAGVKEPNFNGIIDFDDVGGSPPEKIRDILDDLSSKLDCLSIDRRSVRVGDEKGGGRDGEVADYASASSSFSVSPVKAHDGGDLFDGVVESRGQSVGVCEEGDSESFVGVAEDVKFWERRGNGCLEVCGESEVDNFAGVGNNVKFEEGRSFNGKIGKFDGKTEIGGNPLIFSDSDDESCVIMGGKEQLRQDHCTGKGVENVISVDDDDDNDDYDGDSICGLVSDVNDSLSFTWKSLKYTLPDKVEKMLYPHQREGLKWLWSLHCKGTGGILGDDMGLGKTMQICGFLAGLFYSKLIKRVLVVAPKTLLSHWIKELSAVALAEKIREYYAPSAKLRDYELQYVLKVGGILLTTYDIVRNNSKFLRGDFCLNDEISEDNNAWDYVILDEGHIIKNPSTQRAKSLLEIPSSHRIIISGTPIQNNLKELWALFSFCCPSLLGDKNEFKVKYESAILRGNEKNASDREKRIGSTVAKELRERIQPYFLRRLKSEVFSESEETNSGGLSKKNEIIVWLKLTRSQRQLYEAFLNSELVLSSFDGSPLAAITILKKICDHPFLLTKRAAEDILEGMEGILNQDEIGAVEKMALHLANETDAEDSPEIHDVSCKISFIVALLDDLIPKGHNVLIFSQTRKMLNLVQEAITLRGYAFLRIDGTTKAIDRQRIVNDFQNGIGAPIFLLTSQVGGLGLTLTKADRVIVVDPAWNPSTDNQSVDRAYRIGQTKDVLVYRLMTCGTIEEKIYRMQVFKGGLFRTATEKKEQTRYFSKHDLRELFSLPKQGFDVSVTQQQMQAEHDWQNVMHDSLKRHIQFLENQGIAGISDHSLLFSKTAQTPAAEENDELSRKKESTFIGSSRSSSSNERDVNGAEFAFNPKDAKILQKKAAMATQDKPSETEIEDKIYRLRQTLANKAVVSNLPDKGERMQRQIVELNAELNRIRAAKRGNKATIDLDDISGKLQNMLSL